MRAINLVKRKRVLLLFILAMAVATWTPPAALAKSYTFITPTWGYLSSQAGWRMHPVAGRWRIHWGIDIAGPAGTPVLASAAGTVRCAGLHSGYGLTVVIDHGSGWAKLYGHLARATVWPNQIVQQAAVIGAVGSSGVSTEPHLHFEIRYRGVPVNPLAYVSR